MFLVAFLLVPVPVAIVLGVVVVAWRGGSLGESAQERVDREFHRLVARLGRTG